MLYPFLVISTFSVPSLGLCVRQAKTKAPKFKLLFRGHVAVGLYLSLSLSGGADSDRALVAIPSEPKIT